MLRVACSKFLRVACSKFSQLSNGEKIENLSIIIDKVTVCNALSFFFGPPCSLTQTSTLRGRLPGRSDVYMLNDNCKERITGVGRGTRGLVTSPLIVHERIFFA